jgi:signal transduction histidine kinase
MSVELAEVAAGLPFAASFALAGGITTLREGRRRSALNEAVHELRRPLQVLSLALPAESEAEKAVDSSLRLAVAALDRLDREINGGTSATPTVSVSLGPLLEEAVRRWEARARLAGATLRLRWSGSVALVEGDGVALAQAVDNLISNAIDHGGGMVTVEGRRRGAWLLVSVRDSGARTRAPRRPLDLPRRGGGRHGHGLRVVARVARSHGGGFSLRRSERGAEARLRLPLCRTGEER